MSLSGTEYQRSLIAAAAEAVPLTLGSLTAAASHVPIADADLATENERLRRDLIQLRADRDRISGANTSVHKSYLEFSARLETVKARLVAESKYLIRSIRKHFPY